MELYCYVDGSFNLGNTKKSYGSFVILDDRGKVIGSQIFILPCESINEAEYESLIYLLNYIINTENWKSNKYVIMSDSQLLVNQISGDWKIKAKNLKRYHSVILSLFEKMGNVILTWTPRRNIVRVLGH